MPSAIGPLLIALPLYTMGPPLDIVSVKRLYVSTEPKTNEKIDAAVANVTLYEPLLKTAPKLPVLLNAGLAPLLVLVLYAKAFVPIEIPGVKLLKSWKIVVPAVGPLGPPTYDTKIADWAGTANASALKANSFFIIKIPCV